MRASFASAGALLGALALLAVATAALALAIDPFEIDAVVGFEDGFAGTEDHWKVHGEAGNVTLSDTDVTIGRTVDARSYAQYPIVLPAPPEADGSVRSLRVSARAETVRAPLPGVPEGGHARVMLFLFDDPEAAPVRYRTVLELDGTGDVATTTRVIGLDADERSLYLVLTNEDADGTFRLIDASVELVRPTEARRFGTLALVAGWTGFAAWLIAWLVARLGAVAATAVVVPALLIVIGVTLPERTGPMLAFLPLGGLRGALDGAEAYGLPDLFKLGHGVFFFAASVVAFGVRPRLGVPIAGLAAFLAAFAVATEALQLHLPERTSRIEDLAIDGAGVLAGLVIVEGVRAYRKGRRTRRVARIDRAGGDAPGRNVPK